MPQPPPRTIPLMHKLAFGCGMLANQMFPAAQGVFFVVLVQSLGFSPLAWGALFFAPRVLDAISDPIMGFISDNTRSQWGRRRQYILIGAPLLGISYILTWQLYRENSLAFNFCYFMFFSSLFYIALTIFSVPYVAMGYELSDGFHERTNLMAISQFIGQFAWIIAPWFWVVLYDPRIYPSADEGVRQLSIWIGVSCSLLAILPAVCIPAKSTQNDHDYVPLRLSSLWDGLHQIVISTSEAFAIPEFRKLAFATFLVFNSFSIVSSFTFFIVVHHLFDGNAEAAGNWPALHGSIGAIATTFLVIPAVTVLSKKVGKKNAFILSQSISIVGYVLFWFLFVPGKPYLFLAALPFHSFGIGGLFTLMMSMTADVCDLDEFNTGKRREGVLGAVYWWMIKFGNAFAGLLSGVILWQVGFEPNGVNQSALIGLRLYYSILPVVGILGAIAIMWRYRVSEAMITDIRRTLTQRRALSGQLQSTP